MWNFLVQNRWAKLLLAPLFMTVVLAQSGDAFNNTGGAPETVAVSQAKLAEQAAFRSRAAGNMEQIATLVASAPADLLSNRENTLRNLEDAYYQVVDLSGPELAIMKDSLDRNPAWWDVPTKLAQVLHQPAQEAGLFRPSPSMDYDGVLPVGESSDGKPSVEHAVLSAPSGESLGSQDALLASWSMIPAPATYLHDPFSKSCPSAPSLTALAIAQDVEMDLAAINDAINDGLVAVVLGEGTSVPNPLKIASSAALFIASNARLVIEQTRADAAECEDGKDSDILREFTERMRVNLEVVELVDKRSFLLAATEAGAPMDVELVSIMIADPRDVANNLDLTTSRFNSRILRGLQRAGFTDSVINPIMAFAGPYINIKPLVTTTKIRDGHLLITVDPETPGELDRKALIYEITVKHSHSKADGSDTLVWDHTGFTVFHRVQRENRVVGQ